MKRALLNVLSLALLISSLSLSHQSFALDPRITAYGITPNPIQQSLTGSAIFNFGLGTGSETIAAGNISLQISFPNSYYPFPENGTAVQAGTVANLFTWTYDALNRTMTGVSNVALTSATPLGDGLVTITVGGYNIQPAADPSNVNIIYPLAVGAPDGDSPGNNFLTATGTVSAGPAPVTLADFNAYKEGKSALLSWSTTAETNSERFDIEHSLNAKIWTKIGSVLSKGNSNALERYLFTDSNPANGTNFYRLRMVDRDGTFSHTRAKSLEFSIAIDAALYPNPVVDKLLLKVDDFNKVKSVNFINLQGRTILESTNISANGIDVNSLPTGLYVVQVVNINGSVNSFKIMKN